MDIGFDFMSKCLIFMLLMMVRGSFSFFVMLVVVILVCYVSAKLRALFCTVLCVACAVAYILFCNVRFENRV